MKILVTGGTGRVGRSVVAELQADHELVVLCRQPPAIPLPARIILGDHTNLGHVYSALAGVDAVVHLSATPSPLRVPPEAVFGGNVMGVFNIAEAAATLGVKKIVYSGSGSALGFAFRTCPFIPDYLPMDEEHPLRPQDPYGLSKWLGEEILATVTRRTGLPTICLRPPTVLTPEDYAERVPRMLASPGHNTLFAYVDARDFAQAVRLALANDTIVHDRFFITADDALARVPLADIFPRYYPGSERIAARLTGDEPPISSAKAKRLLGYQPRYRWRDLVPEAVER